MRNRLDGERVRARLPGHRRARHQRDQEGDGDRGLENRDGQVEGRAGAGQQDRVQLAGQREDAQGEARQREAPIADAGKDGVASETGRTDAQGNGSFMQLV